MYTKQETLTQELIAASTAYYNGLDSGMTDLEFDRKLEELKKMEQESGIVYPGSPTENVGAAVVSELKKVTHEAPALSLDKVKYKDREDLTKWLSDSHNHDAAVISWKNDGLTCVLTYENGKLVQAATRGNGIDGSDITHNARFFKGVPLTIPYEDHLVVRGEAVMTFEEFDRVNAEAGGEYENPRNLASATIQMLDANESRKREIQFKAFELVTPEPTDDEDEMMYPIVGREWVDLRYQMDRLDFLQYLGFSVVDRELCDSSDILKKIEQWKDDLQNLNYPTDGLVITFNDMVYGMSLGNTGHHFRHSIALKWSDETVTTTIRDIEWSVGKTGIITPVAVFDQVRLGLGSNVTRASLHNLSIMGKLGVMIGSKAEVYLANMIIPQIASCKGGDKEISYPLTCPVCGGDTYVDASKDVLVLKCTNKDCAAQQVGKLMNTFSKDGLFIKGLGESQIVDLLEAGLVDATPVSFYNLANEDRANSVYPKESEFAEKVTKLWEKDGWGRKKWDNLMDAIEASRDTTLQKFLYSLNIPLLGNDLSKKLSKFWHNDTEEFISFVSEIAAQAGKNDRTVIKKAMDTLTEIEGVGEEKARNIVWWAYNLPDNDGLKNLLALRDELNFPEVKDTIPANNSLQGLTFVITGAVHDYKNRDEFRASVEARGGKVAGSVSAKTSYLVNNDVESTSGKNKKAKELGIEIISEDEFISRFGK